ncbi:cytochrome P450 76M5-like [Hordeum vulgare subsp. vulgare]|uniref:cytochrome P450 76M5-like n=1 Tax=Hordeum vulgare subsp. vulgare TaxID=112509 RepID=UPI0002960B0B|nr:cytochrome P450 76M5-like [Hordeum vulgare subsp. vulgare]
MWFSALLACIVAVITVHVVHILHKHNKKRVSPTWPPGPAGYPILGNLLYVIGPLRNNPHSALASLAQTYGPVLSLRLGLTRTIVVVSSAAAAHEALAKNDAALASRLVPDTVHAMSYGATSMVFLPSSNPLWKQDRTIMGARFSSGRGLDTIRPILECHAGHLTEHLRACSGTGTPVVIREAVNRTVLNVISNILFSEDVVDLCMPGPQPFRGLIVPVLEEWSKSNVSDAFPFLAPIDHLLGSRRRISIHLAKLFKFFHQEIIQRRLARTSTGGKNTNDVLDILLMRHAMSKLTRQEIVTFLTDMFIAASDTSTVTVQWAMAQLLRHPEKMDKVRNELSACLAVGSSDFVKESDLDNLPYLHAVVKETLRLHPAVPLIPREVAADGVSLGGFPIPIGTGVVVNLWAIGRDPAMWPQPDKFVPERFLAVGAGEAVHFQGKGDNTYRPFGAGRRVCPGMDYALRSVPLLLASLVHKMEWRLPDGITPEDLDLSDRYGTVLNLAMPLRVMPVSIV